MERTIFFLNFYAAILMGTEYLLTRDFNQKINVFINNLLIKLERHTLSYVKEKLSFVIENKVHIVLIGFFLLSVAIIFLGGLNIWFFDIFIGGFSGVLLGVIGVFGTLHFLHIAISVAPLAPLFLIFYVLATTIRRCPKGSAGGMGFFLLMTSFLLQYTAL